MLNLKKVVILVDDRRTVIYVDTKDELFSMSQFLKVYKAFVKSN